MPVFCSVRILQKFQLQITMSARHTAHKPTIQRPQPIGRLVQNEKPSLIGAKFDLTLLATSAVAETQQIASRVQNSLANGTPGLKNLGGFS